MPFLTIKGIAPYDGRYRLSLDEEFTTREWGWLKRLSGYMPLTIEAGFDGGDPELFAVLAVMAMRRSGKITAAEVPDLFERIVDTPFGPTIQLEADETEAEDGDDADPPTAVKPDESLPIYGTDLRTNSETSPESRTGFGMHDLDTSESRPVTSGS